MRLPNRSLAAFAALIVGAGCGGGAPAADSTLGASPVGGDSLAAVAAPPAAPNSTLQPPVNREAEPDLPGATAAPPRTPAPRSDAPRPGSNAGAPPERHFASDTVRGIVSEVGSYPMTSVVIRPASGTAVTITGGLAREIARAAGAEVWVSGERGPRALDARAYAVRSVDGEPAVDGILARDGDQLVLVTAGGRRPISRPLQALRGMIGARVWLVGPLDGTITSYGVLREP